VVFLGIAPVAADALLDQGAHPFAGAAPFELLETHRGVHLSWDDFLDFHLAISATPFPQEEVVPVEDREGADREGADPA
jgi:hypothetical protein